MKKRKILVIGLGSFGVSTVETLWDAHTEVMAIDPDAAAVDAVREVTSAAYVGDGTNIAVLSGVGADQMDAALVTFGEDFEATVLCVSALATLGVPHIVARAANPRQEAILSKVGATRVVQIESEMGKRVALELSSPVAEDLLDFAHGYLVVPWVAEGGLVGKTLAESNLRQRFGINVLGYRPAEATVAAKGARLLVPAPDYRIAKGDTLMLVGAQDDVSRFLEGSGSASTHT